jgi:hypothetical protein
MLELKRDERANPAHMLGLLEYLVDGKSITNPLPCNAACLRPQSLR